MFLIPSLRSDSRRKQTTSSPFSADISTTAPRVTPLSGPRSTPQSQNKSFSTVSLPTQNLSISSTS